MKKLFLTAIALVLIFISSKAQHERTKSSMELTIGASIPFGTYANGDTRVHNKGYAKTGEAITISYFHHTKTKIGFMASFFGQRNPLNTSAIENKYSNTPYYSLITYLSGTTYPFPNPPPTPPTIYYKNWEFNKGAWYAASLLVGAYTILPLNKEGKLSMTVKAGVGAAYASSPQYKGSNRTDTSFISILQESNHAFGFSYSLAPGLLYVIKTGQSITFNVNYFGTAGMNFNNMKSSGRSEVGAPPFGSISTWAAKSDVEQPVQTINLSLGLRIDLK